MIKNEMPHFDVIIVGSGISGISSACHLKRKCPNKSFVLIEARNNIGGTWDFFKYPGLRSDSDMYTLGFSFKPWTSNQTIANGNDIMDYLNETVSENKIKNHIRFNTKITHAHWHSDLAKWIIDVIDQATGKTYRLSCQFLHMCAGYYKYEGGYLPHFDGMNDFLGEIVHPHQWTKNVDFTNKRIIVIGSGATAATIIPELAKKAKSVVMLQRSPTYYAVRPDKDPLAMKLNRFLPGRLVSAIFRFRNILYQRQVYKKCRSTPELVKSFLINEVRKLIPNVDIKKHFTPKYNPWEQRLCLVPNGDLFKAIRSNKVSVVTDHIDRFTKKGILLNSNQELEADLIISATGLILQPWGGIRLSVDNKPVDITKKVTYKSLMYSGVPNFVHTFGYINASWTLKADITSTYLCRLINLMQKKGYQKCSPELKDDFQSGKGWLSEFSSGYLIRARNTFAKQGISSPWINTQNYIMDWYEIKFKAIADKYLMFDEKTDDT